MYLARPDPARLQISLRVCLTSMTSTASFDRTLCRHYSCICFIVLLWTPLPVILPVSPCNSVSQSHRLSADGHILSRPSGSAHPTLLWLCPYGTGTPVDRSVRLFTSHDTYIGENIYSFTTYRRPSIATVDQYLSRCKQKTNCHYDSLSISCGIVIELARKGNVTSGNTSILLVLSLTETHPIVL